MSTSKYETEEEIKTPVEYDTALKPTPEIPFWFENPNVLFDPHYVYEFYPNENMSYEQKLNAITRTILLITILGFFFTQKIRIIVIGGLTILAILVLYRSQKRKEGYRDPVRDLLDEKKITVPSDLFDEPTPDNPFSNVMIPDYIYNTDKKPAPPSFNENINKKILEEAKQTVIRLNSTQPDIADKLFKNFGDEYEFEQSMQRFVSQPNTEIPNDQTAFAEYLYGSMVSGKEGNLFALARQKSNYNLY